MVNTTLRADAAGMATGGAIRGPASAAAGADAVAGAAALELLPPSVGLVAQPAMNKAADRVKASAVYRMRWSWVDGMRPF
jgi:hypothetical protein